MFYVVRALSPYTEYEFHVIGVNNIGRGPASSPVSVITGETGELSGIMMGFPISELIFHRWKMSFHRRLTFFHSSSLSLLKR